jgi:hypothetical protein
LLASNVSWHIPNDIGSGSADDYKNAVTAWFPAISTWLPTSPRLVVDGPAGTIHATYGVGVVCDGRGAVNAPGTFFDNDQAMRIQVNAEHKITSIQILCDLNVSELTSALNAIKAASK